MNRKDNQHILARAAIVLLVAMLSVVTVRAEEVNIGTVAEWNAFAAFAVETLEMPPEHMPLYSPEKKWSRKAARIRSHIFRSGNLGHNRDTGYIFAPFLWKKTVALRYMISENLHNLLIFPQDTLQVWYQQTLSGISRAARGK